MHTKRAAAHWSGLRTLMILGVSQVLFGCQVDDSPSFGANGGDVMTAPTADASISSGGSSGKSSGSSGKSSGKPSGTMSTDTGRAMDDVSDDDAGTPDATTPVMTPKIEDGETCGRDKECESGHCNNSICCSGGDCCNDVTDCTLDDSGEARECFSLESCQGRRGVASCRKHVCGIDEPVNDDTACGNDVLAADCGRYADVRCNGEPNQEVPPCATRCDDNNDCDRSAYCERNRCVADHEPNADCDANAQCASNSCFQGKCCASGDCCEEASDCPARYTKAATCDDPENCQGSRGEARCNQGRCETATIEDDSDCGWLMPSRLCGQTRRLTCEGGTKQDAPSCGDGTCYEDFQCDNRQHCGTGGRCIDDVANGESCDRDALCASNHCNSGLCCDSGVCCREGEGCEDSARCVEPRECQGERYANECMNFQCTPVETRGDDRVCWGALISSCGNFADLRCSADPDQDVGERGCPNYCRSSAQCDRGLECRGGYCYPPEPPPGNDQRGNNN